MNNIKLKINIYIFKLFFYNYSIFMVVMWTLGDAFKTCYFVIREAPIQFELCSTLQVIIDIAILTQVYIYQSSTAIHTRVPVRID